MMLQSLNPGSCTVQLQLRSRTCLCSMKALMASPAAPMHVGLPGPSQSLCPVNHEGGRAQRRQLILARITPFDQAWGTQIDGQSLASQLFAVSLFPYLAFLFFLTRSGQAPRLTLFGFYFLLAFVGATIPAGIYAKTHYGTSLANVDWLHGSAEALLTVTNLLIVLGLRQAIRDAEVKKVAAEATADVQPAAADDSSSGNGAPAAAEKAETVSKGKSY